MSAFILFPTLAVLFLAGYWFTGRLDRALDNGTIHPYWNSEEEQNSCQNFPVNKKAS